MSIHRTVPACFLVSTEQVCATNVTPKRPLRVWGTCAGPELTFSGCFQGGHSQQPECVAGAGAQTRHWRTEPEGLPHGLYLAAIVTPPPPPELKMEPNAGTEGKPCSPSEARRRAPYFGRALLLNKAPAPGTAFHSSGTGSTSAPGNAARALGKPSWPPRPCPV